MIFSCTVWITTYREPRRNRLDLVQTQPVELPSLPVLVRVVAVHQPEVHRTA